MSQRTNYCPDCRTITTTAFYPATGTFECSQCHVYPVPTPLPVRDPDLPDGYSQTPPASGLVYLCEKCGALVGDTVMHNDWHHDVWSATERANNAVQYDDERD